MNFVDGPRLRVLCAVTLALCGCSSATRAPAGVSELRDQPAAVWKTLSVAQKTELFSGSYPRGVFDPKMYRLVDACMSEYADDPIPGQEKLHNARFYCLAAALLPPVDYKRPLWLAHGSLVCPTKSDLVAHELDEANACETADQATRAFLIGGASTVHKQMEVRIAAHGHEREAWVEGDLLTDQDPGTG
jgi:hypothetical protein